MWQNEFFPVHGFKIHIHVFYSSEKIKLSAQTCEAGVHLAAWGRKDEKEEV